MTRLDLRKFALCGNVLLASALTAFGAGCAGGMYVEPPGGEGQVVGGSVEGDADVVYVQGPPVVDIEAYPAVVYGGANVYYVDGRWYQQGPHGWAYYRREPAELGRQREEHWGRDHDPRWGAQGGAEQRGQAERAVPAAQRGNEERAVPPAQRSGVTEAQPPNHGASPAATAQPRRRVETQEAPAPKRAPAVKRAPGHSPAAAGPEHR